MMAGPGRVCWVVCWLSVGFLLERLVERSGASLQSCPTACICASDLLSCVSQNLSSVPAGLPQTATSLDLSHNQLPRLHSHRLARLSRLTTLRLSHNWVSSISRETFPRGSLLTHLDLSSNLLRAVESHFFLELSSLEELLLYNNRISVVDGVALARLGSLEKLYLSWNQLTHFPFGSLRHDQLPRLKVLDVSSNWFSSLPVGQVSALPHALKNGLYLHNNPLGCDCPLHAMLVHWEKHRFSSVYDFREDHTCLAGGGGAGAPRRFLTEVGDLFGNCTSGEEGLVPAENSYVGVVGQPLLMPCNTSLGRVRTIYSWITPDKELIGYPGGFHKAFKLYPNGSLQIRKAQRRHSGLYICLASNRHLMVNQSQEFNVTVVYGKSDAEGFNTGLTTLLGCLVSLVLVLIYLFLTPCRCWCRKPPPPPPPPPPAIAPHQHLTLPSDESTPPCNEETGRKAGGGVGGGGGGVGGGGGSGVKHVVFLEPVKDSQNGKVRLALSEDFPGAQNPKILQMKSDSESISSVFSDTPIIS